MIQQPWFPMTMGLVGTLLFLLIVSVLTRTFPPSKPETVGLRDNSLQNCGSKPNCVCSLQNDSAHGIAPFQIRENVNSSMEKLSKIIRSMSGARIISNRKDYLYAEFKTAFFGFIDDVEFHVNESANQIEVRSASRLGYSDLGLNRSRVESIRERYLAN
ncbi:MAG: DUF1499 domain-containing protein [Gemmataceae bacterium]